MVVSREKIFEEGEWQGLNPDFFNLLRAVKNYYTFQTRWGKKSVETDPEWQQIIPSAVFVSQGKIFSYERPQTCTDKRLSGERLLSIGGHIRKSDTKKAKSLLAWFRREWEEEVELGTAPFIAPLGVIHDTTVKVSSVHLGFVFLVHLPQPHIKVRATEEIAKGQWTTIPELYAIDRNLRASGQKGIDNWGWLILKYLEEKPLLLDF